MNTESVAIPEALQKDISRAVKILKDAGCAEVFLFGSVAEGRATATSDIDLAVRGCPSGQFFETLGKLRCELDHPVDLFNLDGQDRFSEFLKTQGVLLRLG